MAGMQPQQPQTIIVKSTGCRDGCVVMVAVVVGLAALGLIIMFMAAKTGRDHAERIRQEEAAKKAVEEAKVSEDPFPPVE